MKSQESIKSKAILTFLLAIFSIISAGIFGSYSVQQILTTVDQLAEPDQSSELINSIFTDLVNIESAGRNMLLDETDSASEAYIALVNKLNVKLDTLKNRMAKNDPSIVKIDSVHSLLDQLAAGYRKLMTAQKQLGVNNLSLKLMQELSNDSLFTSGNDNDSSYVIKSTTSWVNVSDFTMRTLDSLNQIETDDERRNIFNRLKTLFNKRPEGSLLDTVFIVPDKQIDTLHYSTIDSVTVHKSVELSRRLAFRANLYQLINEYYTQEKIALNSLNNLKKNIEQKNAMLMENITGFILNIERQELVRAKQTASEAYEASNVFTKVLYFIIGFFVLAGIIMLSFLIKDLRKSYYYEQKLLFEKLRSDKAVKTKQQFLANMSHEIRAPLTSIIGYSELLNDSEYSQAIKKSSEHLLKTANEILDLAKIESGIIEINPEPIHLQTLLDELELSFKALARKKSLMLSFDTKGMQGVWIKSDPFRIRQVFYNLLHNAFKFTESGQVILSAKIIEEKAGRLKIAVKIIDSGIGIAKGQIKKIFKDYHQAGSVNYNQQGTGLGLSIVKKLVGLLNGNIKVTSELGKGTSFEVIFDFEKATETAVAEKKSPETAILSGYDVLVVDDDPLIARLFKIILEKYGAKVMSITGPHEASFVIENQDFDLYIIDLQMPEISGDELASRIRDVYNKKGKILLSTANVFAGTEEEEPFDAVTLKPFTENVLIKDVTALLGIRERLKDLKETGNGKIPEQEKDATYDLSEINRFAMNDPETIHEIVSQFCEETDEDIEILKNKDSDHVRIAKTAHKLASRFGQFKAGDLSQRANEIERKAYNGDVDKEELALFASDCEVVNSVIKKDFQLI